MFTGIVQEVGKAKENDGSSLTIEASASLEGLSLGDSVAVNGTCLTVKSMDEGSFSVDTMPGDPAPHQPWASGIGRAAGEPGEGPDSQHAVGGGTLLRGTWTLRARSSPWSRRATP